MHFAVYETGPVVESLKVLGWSKSWSFPTSSEVIVAQKLKLLGRTDHCGQQSGAVVSNRKVLGSNLLCTVSCMLFEVTRIMPEVKVKGCVCWAVTSLILEGSRDRLRPSVTPPWEKQGKKG